MPKLLKFARSIVGAAACLHRHNTGGDLAKEVEHLVAFQPSLHQDLFVAINHGFGYALFQGNPNSFKLHLESSFLLTAIVQITVWHIDAV